jgi:hypothetical protein
MDRFNITMKRLAAFVGLILLAWGTVALPCKAAIALGAPNSSRFPEFFSLDMVAYKTVDIRFRRFTNSRGIIAARYMMVKWQ